VRYGRCLFITMALPSFSVHGDVVDNYLILAHWMDATAKTDIFLAPVRVVCQNTLMMAQSRAREHIRLTSGPDVRERMAEQLTARVRDAQAELEMVRLQCERLAEREASAKDTAEVLNAAYPSSRARREAALELFNGAGTGMDVATASGTLWGLYNAELENFRDDDTQLRAAYSVLFGARRAAIERAFVAAVRCSQRATGKAQMRSALLRERPANPLSSSGEVERRRLQMEQFLRRLQGSRIASDR